MVYSSIYCLCFYVCILLKVPTVSAVARDSNSSLKPHKISKSIYLFTFYLYLKFTFWAVNPRASERLPAWPFQKRVAVQQLSENWQNKIAANDQYLWASLKISRFEQPTNQTLFRCSCFGHSRVLFDSHKLLGNGDCFAGLSSYIEQLKVLKTSLVLS